MSTMMSEELQLQLLVSCYSGKFFFTLSSILLLIPQSSPSSLKTGNVIILFTWIFHSNFNQNNIRIFKKKKRNQFTIYVKVISVFRSKCKINSFFLSAILGHKVVDKYRSHYQMCVLKSNSFLSRPS